MFRRLPEISYEVAELAVAIEQRKRSISVGELYDSASVIRDITLAVERLLDVSGPNADPEIVLASVCDICLAALRHAELAGCLPAIIEPSSWP